MKLKRIKYSLIFREWKSHKKTGYSLYIKCYSRNLNRIIDKIGTVHSSDFFGKLYDNLINKKYKFNQFVFIKKLIIKKLKLIRKINNLIKFSNT